MDDWALYYLAFLQNDKVLEINQLRKERFILAHGIRGFQL